jgi:hypothetical protein
LLEVPYFHVVFTLPAEIGAIAYQNKAVIYALLFKAASETMLTIAADPKHLGAKVGIISPAHLGFGADPPSPRAHDSHGWRDLTRRIPLDQLTARLTKEWILQGKRKKEVREAPPLDSSPLI